MSKFDRWIKPEQTSWALWQFNDYESQLNNMYWSSVALESFALYHVRRQASGDVRPTLKATGPDANRFDSEKESFLKHTRDMGNWKRASFIMAATGAMESHFQRVVLTALKSDPALLYGRTKAIDGVEWLKVGIDVDYSEILVSITKGAWESRYSKIKGLFGEIPDIRDNIAELDKVRIFRNGVGHAFGRDLDDEPDLLSRNIEEINGLSEERFKKWLGKLSGITRTFDKHLVANHIGDFESLLYLHNYLLTESVSGLGGRPFAKKFKTRITQDIGSNRSIDYYEEMIKYYRGV
ncbi:hypothetical protein [Pseudomonas multiresinivorans]|uniref:RiboL-PSP-HEPN domain-containing protein n=1 Tax=Pseudomonas multiresinivorans TaxID=95301 RepID=A0A7Z3GPX9_9PSED|nr:hypothetical protein [Pseudomonas multiresinivorans]QJP07670.1 hypothetical protein G4G71_07130 [Pseudomonas multiresinivorans]